MILPFMYNAALRRLVMASGVESFDIQEANKRKGSMVFLTVILKKLNEIEELCKETVTKNGILSVMMIARGQAEGAQCDEQTNHPYSCGSDTYSLRLRSAATRNCGHRVF